MYKIAICCKKIVPLIGLLGRIFELLLNVT